MGQGTNDSTRTNTAEIEPPETADEAADLIQRIRHGAEPGLLNDELAELEAVETYLRNRAAEGSDAS
jgi:hypothetical protein